MMARPEKSEASAYYFGYIDQVPDTDVNAVLHDQLEEYGALFSSGISEEKSRHRYSPEKWSIKQVLNHITDAERAFAFRALWFARGFDTPLPSYDQDVAARGAAADTCSLASLAQEFRYVRLSTIALFANMRTEAWLRAGIASDNHFTVRALAYIIAGHSAHHVSILRHRYL